MLSPNFSNDYNQVEAGCDEAGRGCLAGPVYASAVILSNGFFHSNLNDSKKVNAKTRFELRNFIEQNVDSWAVAWCTPEEIDKMNILKSSFIAMHRALDELEKKPSLILVDGNRFIPYTNTDHVCIIKGDGLYSSIAAASILAKTHRDEFMSKMHEQYPEYDWINNKGYPTRRHIEAIKKHGLTPLHRRTFCSKFLIQGLEFL